MRKSTLVAAAIFAATAVVGTGQATGAHTWNGDYGGSVSVANPEWPGDVYYSSAEDQVADTHCVQPYVKRGTSTRWMAKSCGPVANDTWDSNVSSTTDYARHYITGHWKYKSIPITAW